MLSDLAEHYSQIQETFTAASETLNEDLWDIVQNGPQDKLNQTAITQPAMLAAGVATWQVWQASGGAQPAMLAGHSLGEYSALVCAGAIAFEEAVKVVAARGRFMQEAVPAGTGAMAAILGLEDEKVVAVCEQAAQGEVVQAVNFNSPGQVVIAGHHAAVERATEQAKQEGAKRAVLLPVSVPSHCELMRPAAEQLATMLASVAIQSPAMPVVNNVDVQAADTAEAIRDALVRQLYSPVRWTETIRFMAGEGVDTIAECGPGKVLTGLNRRIDKQLASYALVDAEAIDKAKQELEATTQ
jgi:[acyl-carrier-protein] S-malonyltransferase